MSVKLDSFVVVRTTPKGANQLVEASELAAQRLVAQRLQVDPGGLHWAKIVLDADTPHGLVRVADVLAAREGADQYEPMTEHWFGYKASEQALHEATALTIRHTGSFDWSEYPAEWDESPPGRSEVSASMPTDINYTPAVSEPEFVFEGQIAIDGEYVTVRLSIEIRNGELQRLEWYHNGEDVGYLVHRDQGLVLLPTSRPAWLGRWSQYSWP